MSIQRHFRSGSTVRGPHGPHLIRRSPLLAPHTPEGLGSRQAAADGNRESCQAWPGVPRPIRIKTPVKTGAFLMRILSGNRPPKIAGLTPFSIKISHRPTGRTTSRITGYSDPARWNASRTAHWPSLPSSAMSPCTRLAEMADAFPQTRVSLDAVVFA